MATLTMAKALNDGLRAAMERDPKVIVMGEDVGKLGGVFRVTDGLQKDFGVYLVGERANSHAGEHVRHGPGGARARFRVVRPRVPAEALLRREGEQGVPAGRLEVGLVSLSPAEFAR